MIMYKVSYILLSDPDGKVQVVETTAEGLEGMLRNERFEVLGYQKLEALKWIKNISKGL